MNDEVRQEIETAHRKMDVIEGVPGVDSSILTERERGIFKVVLQLRWANIFLEGDNAEFDLPI